MARPFPGERGEAADVNGQQAGVTLGDLRRLVAGHHLGGHPLRQEARQEHPVPSRLQDGRPGQPRPMHRIEDEARRNGERQEPEGLPEREGRRGSGRGK